MATGKPSGERDPDQTSIKVRSALGGERAAIEWIVLRFSPLLLKQAGFRLRARGMRVEDPEDVVAVVWQRALPRLNEQFKPAEGRCTPRLVKFLKTIVNHRVNELLREMLRNPVRARLASGDSSSSAQGAAAVDTGPAVWKRLMLHDDVTRVCRAIEDLEPRDQEIIWLRAIERLPSKDVAERLEVSVSVVDTRLNRALERLRKQFPDGIFDDLMDDEE